MLTTILKSQGNLGCCTEQQDVLEKTPGPKGSEVTEDAQVLIAFLRHMVEYISLYYISQFFPISEHNISPTQLECYIIRYEEKWEHSWVLINICFMTFCHLTFCILLMLPFLLGGKELDSFKRGELSERQNDECHNLRLTSEIKVFDNVNVS